MKKKAQGFVEPNGSLPGAAPIQNVGEEAHDPFMHEVEQVFKKHNKKMLPETRQHLKGLPPEDLTPDNASSGESYQDESDPGKPYGSDMGMGGGYGGVGMGGMGGFGMGSIASSNHISNIADTGRYVKRLIRSFTKEIK